MGESLFCRITHTHILPLLEIQRNEKVVRIIEDQNQAY